MKLKRIWITNYREFRRTFEDDKEAEFVVRNLGAEVEKMIQKGSIDFVLSAAYDTWGDALFDVTIVKVLPSNEVIIDVQYTGTAK